MNSAPVEPGTLAFDAHGIPFSPAYQDIYHPRSGAPAQAQHVFLHGNELPQRWRGRALFVVLETGFGLGHNFLATWQAWRDDAQRGDRLVFMSIEQHPLSREDLQRVHRDHAQPELVDALQRAWPPLTHNLHRLAFDAGRVQLLLALGDVQAWLPELVAQVDAFYLDGFAPARNPRMWDARVCKALARLAAPGATLATWSAAQALRRDLLSAGFDVHVGAGQGGKRDITLARFAPRFVPRRAPARSASGGPSHEPHERHALIVGAGLAGCAAAWALAEQGWHSTLIERGAAPASLASGNPAGLFHGIVNAQDGVHARFNRAAALAAHDAVRAALQLGVPGNGDGLLRLETALSAAEMRALLQRLGLPPDYVQALDADAAGALAGIALTHPAWFYPHGGWVQPAGLARSFLERVAGLAALRTGTPVHALQRVDGGWVLLDAAGQGIARAATVVLANAGDALRLLGDPDWPIDSVRGQISLAAAARLATPRLPIAGAGYLLPALDDRALFGATAQRGDPDPAVRADDHAVNLAQLARLIGQTLDLQVGELTGRTAWRCSSVDRLPVIGAVPEVDLANTRIDQPRFVPRRPGLFVFTALGARGITWSALGAQVLASWVTGTPAPVEASLLDAVDPARFVSRRARQAHWTE